MKSKSSLLIVFLPLVVLANDIKLDKHYHELGVKNLKRVKQGLLNKGILESQIDPVLRGMIRLIRIVKNKGYDFEMDPRMKIYFQKRVGLNQPQLEYVRSMSIRISQRSH